MFCPLGTQLRQSNDKDSRDNSLYSVVLLMDGTRVTSFGGCDEEDVNNVVAVGLNLGVKLANPKSPNTAGLHSFVATSEPSKCSIPIR